MVKSATTSYIFRLTVSDCSHPTSLVTVNLISYISLTPAPNGVVEIIVVLDSVSVPNTNSDSELQRYV